MNSGLFLLALVVAVLLWLVARISGVINSTSGRPESHGRPGKSASLARIIQTPTASSNRQGSELFSATSFYRLKDGSGDYQFRFQQISDGSFRVYILHGPRSENAPATAGPRSTRFRWPIHLLVCSNRGLRGRQGDRRTLG